MVIFLSGMGGVGKKSKVIKAFAYFANNVSGLSDWLYNGDVIKINALTGAATYKYQMPKRYRVRLMFMLIESLKIVKTCGNQQRC